MLLLADYSDYYYRSYKYFSVVAVLAILVIVIAHITSISTEHIIVKIVVAINTSTDIAVIITTVAFASSSW